MLEQLAWTQLQAFGRDKKIAPRWQSKNWTNYEKGNDGKIMLEVQLVLRYSF